MVKALKVVVLDIAASKTGALSILRDFYEYVKNDPSGNEWIFVTGVKDILKEIPEKKIKVICREDVKASSLNRLKFDLVTGKGFVESLGGDVVFSLQNTLPKGLKCKRKVLYVHQPLGFQTVKRFSLFKSEERHLAAYQYLYTPLVVSSVKNADAVIVQTEWMKEAVKKKTGVEEGRIREIAPQIPDISPAAVEVEFDKKSFFYPAGDILYKNHATIDKALSLLKDEGICDISMTYTKDAPLTRDEVCRKYHESTLVFASYIETYGLPLAECMQTGNPILAADTAFARQILKGYEKAYFFDPFDAEGLKKLMMGVYEGEIVPGKKQTVTDKNTYGEIIGIINA